MGGSGGGAITAKMLQAAERIAEALVYKAAPQISKRRQAFPHEIRNALQRFQHEDEQLAPKTNKVGSAARLRRITAAEHSESGASAQGQVRGTDPDRFERQPDNVDSGETSVGSGSRPHPLRGLWLERKVPADSIDPFVSIMDLPHDQAAEVAHKMGKRIADADYVDIRKQAEAWLRSHAAEKGDPSPDNPLYFKLVSEQGTYPPPEGSVVIRIPADSIPAERLTFTIEDSFFNYQIVAGMPASNTPDGLVPRIIHGVDADTSLDFDGEHRNYLDAVQNGRYIEAQVWSRDDPILAEARMRFREGIPTDRTIIVESAPQGGTLPDHPA
ncbi:hypothetical protein [Nocardia carnea]|uniref:hypothetical protein n=1 Tax=Nocardia carnea TaxID=37328 RepID=UPI002454C586|nr:hypothetical protein [Nocardia carnea]